MKGLICLGLAFIFTFISLAVNGQELEKRKDSNDKYGFVDELGNWVIKPLYDNVYPFLDGLAAVKLSDKWGFIDESGAVIVNAQYDLIYPFSQGLAPAKLNDKWGYIDKSNTVVIEFQYDNAFPFSQGLASVQLNDKWGAINKSNTVIIEPQYDDVGRFSEGLAPVKLNNKYGFVDKSNTVIIKPQYESASSFFQGFALVKLNDKWGAIDITSNVIIPITHDDYKSAYYSEFIPARKSVAQKSAAGEYDKIRYAIAVRTGYFSFSNYAQSYVQKLIMEWQKKGEFEKTLDWQTRVNEQTRKQKSIDLTKQAEKEYITLGGDIFEDNLDFTLGSYDADNEVYLFENDHFGMLLVPVPIDKAKLFKTDWESYEVTPKYFINNDQLDLSELTLTSQSDSTEQFKYCNNASLNYTVANITYNFDDLELDLARTSYGGSQNITNRALTIGKSDVDMGIPVTKAVNKNTFAVIISNENYQMVDHVVASLNDGETFKKYCHKTLGIPESNIRFYKDATYGNLLGAIDDIQDISKVLDGELDIIFYYSGHGFPDEKTRDAYLLPIDGSPSQIEISYPISKLYSELSLTKAQHITVFLDACFSGSGRDGTMLASARGIAIKPRMGIPTENMVVFSAASGDETALPYMSKNHGLFTYYLLKKLKESKGNVTLQDLGYYIITNVKISSVIENKKSQTPTVSTVSTRYLVKIQN